MQRRACYCFLCLSEYGDLPQRNTLCHHVPCTQKILLFHSFQFYQDHCQPKHPPMFNKSYFTSFAKISTSLPIFYFPLEMCRTTVFYLKTCKTCCTHGKFNVPPLQLTSTLASSRESVNPSIRSLKLVPPIGCVSNILRF